VKRIEGRVAFVTGGASGIGLAIAKGLLDAGARVALADWDVDELETQAGRLAGPVLPVRLDVTDRPAWTRAKELAERRFGPVDILVNNAGIGPDGRHLADMRPESFDRLVAIKLTGTFNGVHTFSAGMRDRGVGHIVNTASMAGLLAMPGLGAYTAAKFAVVGLTEVLAQELAPYGVGVSVLCPGLIATRLRETTIASGNDVIASASTAVGIDAAIVGELVVDAIRSSKLHIVTHSEYQSLVADRMQQVVQAFDGVPMRGSGAARR
jgi:NAD(P)-dependent dehydrogenase (short-subunit alcohol dehydrogenase family)